MSEYGMIVKNLHGFVVIDSLYRNFSYSDNDTIAVVSGINTLNITDTSDNIIVAYQPSTTGYSTIVSYTKSGSDFTEVKFISEVSQNIDWILYKESPTNTYATSYGLNIFKADGTIAFSSNEDGYYNIVAVHNAYNEEQFSVIDADNNYFIFLNHNHKVIRYGYDAYLYQPGLKKINSTTLESGQIHYSTQTVSVYQASSAGFQVSVQPTKVIEIKPPPGV